MSYFIAFYAGVWAGICILACFRVSRSDNELAAKEAIDDMPHC